MNQRQSSLSDALVRCDDIDLTAKAWIWISARLGYDRNSPSKSMSLKSAVRLAATSPNNVLVIQYENGRGGTSFFPWKKIAEISKKEELWKD